MTTEKQDKQRRAIMTLAYGDYAKGMKTYSFFKMNSRAVGDDLVQDTFVKTWNYLVKGGKIEAMKAFLYHVLNHLIIDEYRKSKTVSLDALSEKGYEPSADRPGRLFDIFDGKAALLLIQHLPPKYRKVIRMRYIQDLSLKEISLITGQSRNAIAVQAFRGLEKLKLLYHPA